MENKYPVKSTYTVEYWDCGIAEHHHKTYEIASACLSKQNKAAKYNERHRREYQSKLARNKAIAAEVIYGATILEAAINHGVSPETARNAINRVLIKGFQRDEGCDVLTAFRAMHNRPVRILRNDPDFYIKLVNLAKNT